MLLRRGDKSSMVIIMNTNDTLTELDQLFLQARETEPQLIDQQFTAKVVDSVVAERTLDNPAKSRHSFFMDVITAGLGVGAVSYFFDLQQVYAFVIGVVPESVVINPMSLVVAALGMSCLTVASWWVIEQQR